MQALAHRHDVIAVEVVDPRELSLPDVGLFQVVEPRRVAVGTSTPTSAGLRDRYEVAAAERSEYVARRITSSGADHLVLRTDRDWVVDLVRFVAGRRSRRLAAAGGRR